MFGFLQRKQTPLSFDDLSEEDKNKVVDLAKIEFAKSFKLGVLFTPNEDESIIAKFVPYATFFMLLILFIVVLRK